jgi:hypothetical protein
LENWIQNFFSYFFLVACNVKRRQRTKNILHWRVVSLTDYNIIFEFLRHDLRLMLPNWFNLAFD